MESWRAAAGVIGTASLISLLVSRDGRWLRDDCLVAAGALACLWQKYKAEGFLTANH